MGPPVVPSALTSSLPSGAWSLHEKVVYVEQLCNRFLLHHLPSFPSKKLDGALGKACKQRRSLEAQPVFGESSEEIMSLLEDIKASAHNSRKPVSTLSKELPTRCYLA